MRVPYIMLAAVGAMALCSCATPASSFPGNIPTQLPSTVTVDDKIGISVEVAYQAAALAVQTGIKAGFVTPSQAARLAELDNQAYKYLCYTRTAYDLANGKSPALRKDTCPVETKSGAIPTYADAARSALTILQEMIGSLHAYQQARYDALPQVPYETGTIAVVAQQEFTRHG